MLLTIAANKTVVRITLEDISETVEDIIIQTQSMIVVTKTGIKRQTGMFPWLRPSGTHKPNQNINTALWRED